MFAPAMPSPKPKIIYVTPIANTFSSGDIALLQQRYRVVLNHYEWWNRDHLTPIYYLLQFFFLLWHLPSTHALVVSFGGYWALLPSLLGKLFGVPTYIILNGTDCAALPEIGYGILRKPYTRFVCQLCYRYACKLLPVSPSLVRTENHFIRPQSPSLQGLQHHFPTLKTPYDILPNGVDPQFWYPDPSVEREPASFMTIMLPGQFKLKGGDLILEAATKLPQCRFYIAGVAAADPAMVVPQNVTFLGFLEPEALRSYYQRCRFSLQPSAFEGFGLSICEAMACACIPIVATVNSLPDLAGDQALYLSRRSADDLYQLLREEALSLAEPEAWGKAARERVVQNYSLQKRAAQLFELIGSA